MVSFESKLLLNVVLLLFGSVSFVLITAHSISWNQKISKDFKYKENENQKAYQLYMAVLCLMITCTLLVAAIVGISISLALGYKCIATDILAMSSMVMVGIILIEASVVILSSTDNRCTDIFEKGLKHGQSTIEYQKWRNEMYKYSDHELNYARCQGSRKRLSIYSIMLVIALLAALILFFMFKKPQLVEPDEENQTFPAPMYPDIPEINPYDAVVEND